MEGTFLIVEDDAECRQVIHTAISVLGYEVKEADNGKDGLNKALQMQFQMVILDINLPGMPGTEVCRELRRQKPNLPLMMLTARSDDIDKVLALELGADDYLTKPFNVRELQARIGAILRRCERQRALDTNEDDSKSKIVRGDLSIDLIRHEVTLAGKLIALSSMEWDLLVVLASTPGRVYTREQLMNHLWGYVAESCESVVTSHFCRLRSKLEPDPANPRYILTVRGVGYRFAD